MTKIYGIVGTQRSGSNFLCSVLRSVTKLGDPREYFNPVHIPNEKNVSLSVNDAGAFAKDLVGKTPAGQVFGLKIHYLQFFQNFLQKGVRLEEAFPGIRIINLRRVNVAQQAISLWKAELTQSWTAKMPAIRDAHYDFEQIQRRYFDLKIHDIMWRKYLSENKLEFLNIFYEDIVRNQEKSFFQVFAYLGRIDLISDIKIPEMKKQADDVSANWEENFRNDYAKYDDGKKVKEWVSRCKFFNAEDLPRDPNIWNPFEIVG